MKVMRGIRKWVVRSRGRGGLLIRWIWDFVLNHGVNDAVMGGADGDDGSVGSMDVEMSDEGGNSDDGSVESMAVEVGGHEGQNDDGKENQEMVDEDQNAMEE